MMRLFIPALAICAAAPAPCSLAGQAGSMSPAVSGLVLDSQNRPIADAHVTFQTDSVLAAETVTDTGGTFKVERLHAGQYTLTISVKDFAQLTASLTVVPGQPLTPTYMLRVAGAQTTVDVVVTATRSERTLAEVPASVSVVDAHRIEQTPARTLDDVLRRVPSVDLPLASTNEQHPTDTIVSMRGLGGIRSLVLLDGLPLHDPFFGFLQWSEVPTATVERVEVVRGGGATLWGNYAMGGVMNILTRPVKKTALVVETAGGSRGTHRTAAHAAVAESRFGLGMDGGWSGSRGYLEQANGFRGPVDVPTSFSAGTLALSADAELTPELTARGRVSHYSNAMNYLTRLQTNGEGTNRYTGSLLWQPRPDQTGSLSVFHTDERFTTNNTGTPAGADPTAAEYLQNAHRTMAGDLGASALWTGTYRGVLRSVSVGADYHGIHGSDAATILDERGVYIRTDLGTGSQRFLGVFGQVDLRPLRQLEVLVSLRLQNFYNLQGVDNTPGGLGTAVPTRVANDADPRVSVRYQLPAGISLRAAAYRAFRAPTLDNLYRSASVPGYILYSNAALRPETLNGGEAGVDVEHGPMRLEVTAYSSHIANLLTYRYLDPATLPTGFAVGARLINAASGVSRGLEGELHWRLRPGLQAVLGYTWADSVTTHNAEDPASVGVQQPGIPKNKGTATLTWTAPRGITVSPSLRYLSRTTGDPDNLFHTDPHLVTDLALTVPLRERVEAFTQIENLLARTYIGTNDGFTAPLYGRPFTVVAGVRLKLR